MCLNSSPVFAVFQDLHDALAVILSRTRDVMTAEFEKFEDNVAFNRVAMIAVGMKRAAESRNAGSSNLDLELAARLGGVQL